MYYDMNAKWDTFEKKLTSDSFSATINREKNLEILSGQYSALNYFYDKYHLDNDYIKCMIPPEHKIFSLNEIEQREYIDYFVTIFGSAKLLVRYINYESNNTIYGTIFGLKKEIVSERLVQFCDFFDIKKEVAINMSYNYTGIFNLPFGYNKNKVEQFAQTLSLEENQIKKFAIRYPHIMGINPENYKKKIPNICNNLEISFGEYVSMIKKYPPIMISSKSELLKLSNHGINNLLDYPVLVNVCNLIGYRNFDKTVKLVEYIQNEYGKIIDIGSTRYNGSIFNYLIIDVVKDAEYAIVSIGDVISNYNTDTLFIKKFLLQYESYIIEDRVGIIERFTYYNVSAIDDAVYKCCVKYYSVLKF